MSRIFCVAHVSANLIIGLRYRYEPLTIWHGQLDPKFSNIRASPFSIDIISMLYKPVISVDVVGGELARGHAALEHDIHLFKRTILGLWKSKPSPQRGQSVQTAPKESLSNQISGISSLKPGREVNSPSFPLHSMQSDS